MIIFHRLPFPAPGLPESAQPDAVLSQVRLQKVWGLKFQDFIVFVTQSSSKKLGIPVALRLSQVFPKRIAPWPGCQTVEPPPWTLRSIPTNRGDYLRFDVSKFRYVDFDIPLGSDANNCRFIVLSVHLFPYSKNSWPHSRKPYQTE